MPDDDIPAVWKAYQKQQEDDHRRCTRAAIDDQQLTAERARAEHTAWQNKVKEKDALKLTLCDKVGKADVINHGDVEFIEISEKKDGASPSKSDPPISPAAKWHEVEPSIYQRQERRGPDNRHRRRRTRSHGQDRGLSPSSTR